MYKIKILLLVITGLVCSVQAGSPSQLICNLDVGRPQTLVTYGTSLTSGGKWRHQLAEVLKAEYGDLITVKNGGRAGEDSRWGKQNVEERVLVHHPDAVTIEFSMNDAIHGRDISVEEAGSNLLFIVNAVLDENPAAEIILLTMNCRGDEKAALPYNDRWSRHTLDDHYQMVRDIAAERGFRLIDLNRFWIEWKKNHPEKFTEHVPDGIHPDEAACREVVLPVLMAGMGIPELETK